MPRIGLVLGAGGVVGHAFHAGVLAALAEGSGWDPRDAGIIVGTSAGSVVGSLLRAGMAAPDLARSSAGEPLSRDGEALRRRAGGPRPPVPSRPPRPVGLPRMAAPGMFVRAAMRPFWLTRPGALAAAALPAGQVPTELVAEGVRPLFDGPWPDRPLWITAVRLHDGRRVVFGRDGAPSVNHVADAVAASCAIPGFFQPVVLDGVRYVDGGAHSPTNADLLARAGLDLVVISSPMSVTGNLVFGRVDLPARRLARMYLAQEANRLRRRRTAVLAFQPTPDDLSVMGLNAMDPSRRADVTAQARESTLRKLERADVRDSLRLLETG